MAVQRTFSILKPDVTRRNLTGAVNQRIEAAGLRIVAQKRVQMTSAQAETFYGVHRERPFFGELVEMMTAAPVVVQVLEGEDAIQRYRDVMGATEPEEGGPGNDPQRLRAVDGRELGPWLGRAGDGGAGDRAIVLRQRDRGVARAGAPPSGRSKTRSAAESSSKRWRRSGRPSRSGRARRARRDR